jgi:hypothetical protein|tara:strand:- start:999 stop:1310 length:312 start_codon:yes stop_codon:yes gene_type:complete
VSRLNKAARGKHRWIGLSVSDSELSRLDCQKKLESELKQINSKLFDFINVENELLAIIKVPLKNYRQSLEILNHHETFKTITSSGKIILVRERLGIKVMRKKR